MAAYQRNEHAAMVSGIAFDIIHVANIDIWLEIVEKWSHLSKVRQMPHNVGGQLDECTSLSSTSF